MRALILAAGRGNRLGSLTAEKPKSNYNQRKNSIIYDGFKFQKNCH